MEVPAAFEKLAVRVRGPRTLAADGNNEPLPFAGDLAAVRAGRGVLLAPATVRPMVLK